MLFAMNDTAQQTTNSANETTSKPRDSVSGVPQFPPSTSNQAKDDGLTAAELQALKDEKLAIIRRALENGDYDSDAILEKALDRMLVRLEEADSE